MLTPYQQKSLQDEIKYNLREVYWHAIFTCKLIGRYFKKSIQRNPKAVEKEYEAGWGNFWVNKDYFSNDKYPFVENTKMMDPMISPFQYQLEITDRIIADYIRKHNFKSVLEIGSGTGLHMINLAALFPEVQFYGLELTKSGVDISRKLLNAPPEEFKNAHGKGALTNVTIIHGNVLEDETVKKLSEHKYDLIFSTTVLEQLHNYLNVVFSNIFKLEFSHFLFHEQWLEHNTNPRHYRLLLENDYFRAPLELLNHFPAKVIETTLPAKQPIGMNLAMVFGEKVIK